MSTHWRTLGGFWTSAPLRRVLPGGDGKERKERERKIAVSDCAEANVQVQQPAASSQQRPGWWLLPDINPQPTLALSAATALNHIANGSCNGLKFDLSSENEPILLDLSLVGLISLSTKMKGFAAKSMFNRHL